MLVAGPAHAQSPGGLTLGDVVHAALRTSPAIQLAQQQLQAEQERLKVGLSTTRFVLDFQRDLATAQGNELRATVDYNKALSNFARHKATTLDRYNLQLN